MRKLLILLAGSATALLLAGLAFWGYRANLPDSRLAHGQQLVRLGHYQQARQVADQLAADGHLDHGHLLRGEVFLGLAGGVAVDRDRLEPDDVLYYRQAIHEFNQIQDEGEIRLQAAALTGQCLVALGQFIEAERVLDFVLSERPDHVDAHRALAVVYYDLGALAYAAEHLTEVARLDPDDGRPHRLLGLIHKDMEQFELAADSYREALRRRLSEATAHEVRLEMAESLVRLSRYGEALESIKDDRSAAALRAECLWGLGRADEAQALLDEAMKQGLDTPDALRLRAKLYQEAGESAEAARLLEKVVARDRHDHASRYQLALTLDALGRAEDADHHRRLCEESRALFKEMSDLTREAIDRPYNAAVRRRLAKVCEKLDKKELAAMWLRAADAQAPPPR